MAPCTCIAKNIKNWTNLKQKLDADGCIDTSSGTQYTNWNKSTNQDKCGSSNKGGSQHRS